MSVTSTEKLRAVIDTMPSSVSNFVASDAGQTDKKFIDRLPPDWEAAEKKLILDRYYLGIHKNIGRGSFARVRKGYDIVERKEVAIKCYHASEMGALASYEETLRRFANQVRNMAILKGEVALPQSSPGRSRAESLLSVDTPPGLSMVKSETLELGDVVLPMEAYSVDEYGAPGPDLTDCELYAIFELGVVTLKQYLARIYSRPSRLPPKSRSRVSSCALSKAELAHLVVPLLEMMYAVHSKGLVHLDLKPGNVMLGRANKWKMIDFDGAVKAGSILNPEDSLVAFTAAYCSPELARAVVDLKSRTSRGRVGGGGVGVGDAAVVVSRKMDVWSLGITICEIFSGECPTAKVLASLVGSSNRGFEYFQWLSDFSKPLAFHVAAMRRYDLDLADLVERMLVKDPENRISTTQCLTSDYYIKNKSAIEEAGSEQEIISWRGDDSLPSLSLRRSHKRRSIGGGCCGLRPKRLKIWPLARKDSSRVRPRMPTVAFVSGHEPVELPHPISRRLASEIKTLIGNEAAVISSRRSMTAPL